MRVKNRYFLVQIDKLLQHKLIHLFVFHNLKKPLKNLFCKLLQRLSNVFCFLHLSPKSESCNSKNRFCIWCCSGRVLSSEYIMNSIKCIVTGDGNVGKTSLLLKSFELIMIYKY